jgi:hypothetical protein
MCVWERERGEGEGEREGEDACVCGRPVLLDAPIVIVGAAAWFIILLIQITNKMGSQKKNLHFCGRKSVYISIFMFLYKTEFDT